MSPFELRGNQQKAVHEVKDMVDLQGPFFFFPVKLSITTITIVSKKKLVKYWKVYKLFTQKYFWMGQVEEPFVTCHYINDYKKVSCGKTSWSLNF